MGKDALYNPVFHNRQSIRLRGYDYSRTGTYFVTICLDNIRCTLATANNKQIRPTDIGQIAQ
jgi:hypothetical protein